MRRDVTFVSKGLNCAGWLYVPDELEQGRKAPAIVMAHGFSGVKEQFLSNFADKFVAAGFVTLVFDYRYLGGSEGEPRNQVIWHEQLEDYRSAITWVSEQPEVDRDRIGLWGTSLSGGHVLWLSAYDKRVKAVVSQVFGGVSMWDVITHLNGPEGLEQLQNLLMQDRIQRYRNGEVGYIKVVAPEGEPCVLGGEGAYQFFTGEFIEASDGWQNRVSLESVESLLEYDVKPAMGRIAPTPLLMVLAEHDELVPLEMAMERYELADGPKDLVVVPCTHFQPYSEEPWFSKTVEPEVKWFQRYLM